jgi:prepilin-type N-terminal cleavage/methylation domain-containing protein
MRRQGIQDRRVCGTRKTRRAFTLVEILMVVIILGIGSAIIIPQLNGRDDLKVSAASRSLMADLMYAQNQAIYTQTRQYVTFDTTTQKYTVLSGAWPGTAVTHPLSKDPFVVNFGAASTNFKEITMVSADLGGGRTTLGFDPLGAPLSIAPDGTATAMTTGSVVLRAGAFPLTVRIEPYTGELTVN